MMYFQSANGCVNWRTHHSLLSRDQVWRFLWWCLETVVLQDRKGVILNRLKYPYETTFQSQ